MNFEAFWEKHIADEAPLNHNLIIEVFSTPLDEQVREKYDLVDTLLPVISFYEERRDLKGLEELKEMLANHQPLVLEEARPYLDDVLLKFYLFHEKREAVAALVDESFENFETRDYDMTVRGIRQLVLAGYTAEVERWVDHTYRAVDEDPDLLPTATLNLSLWKGYALLEKAYRHYRETGQFDWTQFRSEGKAFGWEVSDRFFEYSEKSFTQTPAETGREAKALFPEGRPFAVSILQKSFMKYMFAKGMTFQASGVLWDFFHQYWEDNNPENNYFSLAPISIYAFAGRLSGMVLDLRFHGAAILWGASHVYDFLQEAGLIDEKRHEAYAEWLTEARRLFMEECSNVLWEFQFVLRWPEPSPRMATQRAWEETNFRASYEQAPEDPFSVLDEKEAEALREKFHEPRESWLDFLPELPSPSKELHARPVPVRQGRKIGRNERVTVRYTDGTIKKDLKYKKVQGDIEEGLCELVE